MSYEIVYDRQFIKTRRGIIPCFLYGSNNCYEITYKGREVRERNWSNWSNDIIDVSAERIIEFFKTWTGGTYQEHFMMNGKWFDDNALMRWVNNGLKSALTIEDIGYTAKCTLSIYDRTKECDDKDYFTHKSQDVKTTEELESWVDMAKERLAQHADNERVYITVGFYGREPLRLHKQNIKGNVIVKYHNQYIEFVDDDGSGFRATSDISNALVFKSVEDAKAKIKYLAHYKMRFMKATNKEIVKSYRIFVKSKTHYNGYYVYKVTRGGLRGTVEAKNGMGFVSEKAAQKYIDNLKRKFLSITEYQIITVA